MCTAAVIAILTAWVIINRYSILCVCRRCDRGIPNTRFVFIHTQRPYSDQFISKIIACTGCAGEELGEHLIRCIRGTVCSGWTLRALCALWPLRTCRSLRTSKTLRTRGALNTLRALWAWQTLCTLCTLSACGALWTHSTLQTLWPLSTLRTRN